MATLLARANNGNFTDSTTWGLVDPTSILLTPGSTNTWNNLSTTYQSSSAFTPGAITIDGVAVQLAARQSNIGTMTVGVLQAGTPVTGTEVTINFTDIPSLAAPNQTSVGTTLTSTGGGWIFCKFAAPVALAAATAYTVGMKSTNGGQIYFWNDNTTRNWCRALRTTTTSAPAASDNLIIGGEFTAPATSTPINVVMNNTATTAFGFLDLSPLGTLTYGVAAATNYYLKLTGDLSVRSMSSFKMGTVGVPIPANSTAVLEFNCSSVGQYGFTVQSGATFESYGASKTPHTLLTADAAVSASSFTVGSTAGWQVSDEVGFGPTARTIAQYERKVINTVPTGTTFTTTAGNTFAHSGASPTQGIVVNLTRNVKIRGMSTTSTTAHVIWDAAVFSATNTEFYYQGSGNQWRQGIITTTITGSTTFQSCAFHDLNSAAMVVYSATSGTCNLTINNCAFYDSVQGIQILQPLGAVPNVFLTNNAIVAGNRGYYLAYTDLTLTGNRIAGINNDGISFPAPVTNFSSLVFNNNYINTCNIGVSMGDLRTATLGSCTIWFCTSSGSNNGALFPIDLTIDSWTLFGNAGANIQWNNVVTGNLTFKNLVLNSHATFTTPYGLRLDQANRARIINSTFGTTVPHTTADVYIAPTNPADTGFHNCLFGSTTEMSYNPSTFPYHVVFSQNHDQVAGASRFWYIYGLVTTDTTIYDIASPSIRIAPSSATFKIRAGNFRVAVPAGGTGSLSLKVRKSVSGDGATYNGAQPRLILRASPSAGVLADTVVATATSASAGAWETLVGTSPALTSKAVLEYYVDCDGTTGWVNVDSVGVNSSIQNTNNLDYLLDGQPVVMSGAVGEIGLVGTNFAFG